MDRLLRSEDAGINDQAVVAQFDEFIEQRSSVAVVPNDKFTTNSAIPDG
jgi:hypothetical protein